MAFVLRAERIHLESYSKNHIVWTLKNLILEIEVGREVRGILLWIAPSLQDFVLSQMLIWPVIDFCRPKDLDANLFVLIAMVFFFTCSIIYMIFYFWLLWMQWWKNTVTDIGSLGLLVWCRTHVTNEAVWEFQETMDLWIL